MELRLLGEIVDSLSETGNGQDEPGISCHARRRGSPRRHWDCVKRTPEPT